MTGESLDCAWSPQLRYYCICLNTAELTLVTSELMKTVRRGHLTVEPGGANYEAWMTLSMETATVSNPVHIGSSDKSRQQRVKSAAEQYVDAATQDCVATKKEADAMGFGTDAPIIKSGAESFTLEIR